MTDARCREWPPASVWLLALLMTVPPLALFCWMVFGRGLDTEALAGGVVGVPVAAALLAGWRVGWWLAVLGTVQMLAGCVAAGFAIASGPVNLGELAAAAVFTSWTATSVVLLWWPEPRRWCGVLPPAEAETGD